MKNRSGNFLLKLGFYSIGFILLIGCESRQEFSNDSLVGYWKLDGDCIDYSGNGNDGINHGVELSEGLFDGISSYVEVPHNETFSFGGGDFTINIWVYTDEIVDDVIGNILSKYDSKNRCGFNLSINSTSGGYQSIGNNRHVYFGIDNSQLSDWIDCGKPSPNSEYISNSLTVYEGHLYAGVANGKEEKDWAHVFRYEGGVEWTDLGRLGSDKTTGAFPMIVHNGNLYVATATHDWTRYNSGEYDPGRVYRYAGKDNWIDCGMPNDSIVAWNAFGSFQGKLFIGGGPKSFAVYTQKDGTEDEWVVSKIFDKSGSDRCYPHTFLPYNNKLYTAFPFVHSFDGHQWTYEGDPVMTDMTKGGAQTHKLISYRGSLVASTWPEGRVSKYLGNKKWESMGHVGEDATEGLTMAVYNGKLYCGSIPRAEISRYDGGDKWTSLKRFYSPEGWELALPRSSEPRAIKNKWSRVTSLTVYDGKLFASTGNNTSSSEDIIEDGGGVHGRIYYMEAGKNVSYDHDIGYGWKQITAIRRGGFLELYINGDLVARSSEFDSSKYDLTNDEPLKIGFGELDYFNGKISDLKIYRKALNSTEILESFKREKKELFSHSLGSRLPSVNKILFNDYLSR